VEIKTPLKKLISLFAQSASTEELTMPVRQFAAQLTVLTAHVDRLEAKIETKAKILDAHIAELATLIAAAQEKKASPVAATTPSTAAPGAPATATTPASVEEAQHLADMTEEEATEAMLAKAQQELEADLADAKEAPPVVVPKPTAITPLRKTNGGKKASAGEVA
jgi:hypothetical protein